MAGKQPCSVRGKLDRGAGGRGYSDGVVVGADRRSFSHASAIS